MKRSILTRTVQLALMLAVFFLATACDQSPLFYSISNETERKTAAVPGTPTRTVRMATSGSIFVANGKLLKRTGSAWRSANRPDGELVRDLAAIGDTLFAMTLPETGSATKLWKSVDDAANWSQIDLDPGTSGYDSFDSLFTAGPVGSETLFVGAHMSGTEYVMLRYDAVGSTLVLEKDVMGAGGILTGATYLDLTGEYFLSTESEGIWSGTALGALTVLEPGTVDSSFILSGIIAVDTDATAGTDTVVAVGRGENLLLSKAGADFTSADKGYIFPGALAVYADGTRNRLLAAIQDGITYGFMEIDIPGLADVADAAAVTLAKTGGDSASTIDYNQYAGALGTEAIVSLTYFNAASGVSPDGGILFASTANEGLWSSTNRGDWNLES